MSHRWIPVACIFFILNTQGWTFENRGNNLGELLELSDYVTIVVIVPESHADLIRKVMGEAGAGESEKYSQGSFSTKGLSRYMPKKGAHPFLGKEGILETVVEERIETICLRSKLKEVIEAIKKAHPYEETVIDIIPIYEIGFKS